VKESPGSGIVHVWTLKLDTASGAPRASAWTQARAILARYLDCLPSEVPIERTGVGKPILGPSAPRQLAFSLSHSGTYGLLAITGGQSSGVDLERVREVRDARALAARFFTPEEAEAIRSVGGTEDDLRDAFFRTWVRKEAYLKGLGETVPGGLRRFEVRSEGANPPRIVSTTLETTAVTGWSLRDLDAPDGFAAAVALEGDLVRVVLLPAGTTQRLGNASPSA